MGISGGADQILRSLLPETANEQIRILHHHGTISIPGLRRVHVHVKAQRRDEPRLPKVCYCATTLLRGVCGVQMMKRVFARAEVMAC